MTQLNLFGQEATTIVQGIKKERTPRKREPTRIDVKWELQKSIKRLEELSKQDETGWSDFDISIKGKAVNMPLVQNHIKYYSKQLAEMRSQFNPMLNEWKEFITNLCKEKGQEIEHIWFDDSSPYDCCIEIRLKGHKCWSSCVSFRFRGNILEAYDSDFGHGTSFIEHLHQTHIDRQNKIREVMENVFNRECEAVHCKFWEPNEENENRKIFIDEFGWFATQGSILA